MAVLIALAAFVAMEPTTYLVHRFVMHGRGIVWHRSHHNRRTTRFERNDWFPVCFAAITIVVFTIGFNVESLSVLLPIAVGVTAYGAAYGIVHDGHIHGRFRTPVGGRYFAHVAAAHELHHRFGAEPYGMLAPVVPASLRSRARSADARERVAPVPGT